MAASKSGTEALETRAPSASAAPIATDSSSLTSSLDFFLKNFR
jgi:hypothetical protein